MRAGPAFFKVQTTARPEAGPQAAGEGIFLGSSGASARMVR
jgi:hypothetical protein